MAINVETLAAAMGYTKSSLEGVGAIAGKPCQIQSITEISGGHRVTFLWVDNSNVEHTSTMEVMDGGRGISSVAIVNNHLIITYTDGTTEDAGYVGGGGGGTYDYDDLTNKPQINNVELTGNKSLSDLGVEKAAVEVTGTLVAGQTGITLSNPYITTDSKVDPYTDVYGVNPTGITVANGSVTLTFEAQLTDLGVKVVIK